METLQLFLLGVKSHVDWCLMCHCEPVNCHRWMHWSLQSKMRADCFRLGACCDLDKG